MPAFAGIPFLFGSYSEPVRPQCSVTSVLAGEELLPGFGSEFAAETVAVLFSFVPSGAVTCTVICMTAPFSRKSDNGIIVPTLQLTAPLANVQGNGVVVQASLLLTIEQAILVPDALKKLVPSGSVSLTFTLTAFAVP